MYIVRRQEFVPLRRRQQNAKEFFFLGAGSLENAWRQPSTLRSCLKEKERARAISGRSWRGFPLRGHSVAFRPLAPLVASLLDASACGFAAVSECLLVYRFELFEDPHAQASLGCIECLRRSRASALPSCDGTYGRNPSCRSPLTRHSAERIRLTNQVLIVGRVLRGRAFVRLDLRPVLAVPLPGNVRSNRGLFGQSS